MKDDRRRLESYQYETFGNFYVYKVEQEANANNQGFIQALASANAGHEVSLAKTSSKVKKAASASLDLGTNLFYGGAHVISEIVLHTPAEGGPVVQPGGSSRGIPEKVRRNNENMKKHRASMIDPRLGKTYLINNREVSEKYRVAPEALQPVNWSELTVGYVKLWIVSAQTPEQLLESGKLDLEAGFYCFSKQDAFKLAKSFDTFSKQGNNESLLNAQAIHIDIESNSKKTLIELRKKIVVLSSVLFEALGEGSKEKLHDDLIQSMLVRTSDISVRLKNLITSQSIAESDEIIELNHGLDSLYDDLKKFLLLYVAASNDTVASTHGIHLEFLDLIKLQKRSFPLKDAANIASNSGVIEKEEKNEKEKESESKHEAGQANLSGNFMAMWKKSPDRGLSELSGLIKKFLLSVKKDPDQRHANDKQLAKKLLWILKVDAPINDIHYAVILKSIADAKEKSSPDGKLREILIFAQEQLTAASKKEVASSQQIKLKK